MQPPTKSTPVWVNFTEVRRRVRNVLDVPPGWTPRGVDPGLLWADVTSYRGFGPAASLQTLPFILYYKNLRTLAHSINIARGRNEPPIEPVSPEALLRAIDSVVEIGYILNRSYLEQYIARGAKGPIRVTGWVPKKSVLEMLRLLDKGDFRAVMSSPVVEPPKTKSLVIPDEQLAGAGGKPVIAVIDDLCPCAHALFRQGATATSGPTTRIKYLLDQGFKATGVWRGDGAHFGREITSVEINALLTSHLLPDGGIDEARLYRELQLPGLRPIEADGTIDEPIGAAAMPRASHGSGVLGLAAGKPDPRPPADNSAIVDADIVFVQLPPWVVSDTSGKELDGFVQDAVHYILSRSAPNAKIVINLSYGTAAGPHDGSTLLEGFFDQTLEARSDLAIVLPAGNLYRSRMHVRSLLDAQRTTCSFAWDVPAGSLTPGELQLWPRYLGVALPSMRVRVLPPHTLSSDAVWVSVDEARYLLDEHGFPMGQIVFSSLSPNGDGPSITIYAGPTEIRPGSTPSTLGRATAGQWRVDVELLAPTAALILDGWIQRNDPSFGGGGQQSTFPAYEGAVERRGTLSECANSPSPIVVGAYVEHPNGIAQPLDSTMAPFSSSARGRPAHPHPSPHVSAPGRESAGAPGLLVPGCFSGDWVRMEGTSISAPIVARRLLQSLRSQSNPANTGETHLLAVLLGTGVTSTDRERTGDAFLP